MFSTCQPGRLAALRRGALWVLLSWVLQAVLVLPAAALERLPVPASPHSAPCHEASVAPVDPAVEAVEAATHCLLRCALPGLAVALPALDAALPMPPLRHVLCAATPAHAGGPAPVPETPPPIA